MQFKKEDIFTVPNILTYIRILLVPVFIIFYLQKDSLTMHILSIAVILLAGLTDIIDGKIARKTNQITDLGKIIDPIADKAMQFAMLFCVTYKYHLVGILIIIYGLKEIVSLCFSGYLFTKGRNIDGAKWCGKICTVVLYIVMLILIVVPKVDPHVVAILVGFSAAFMFLAFFIYMNIYVRMLIDYKHEQKENKEE